jgi:hypothetical protein
VYRCPASKKNLEIGQRHSATESARQADGKVLSSDACLSDHCGQFDGQNNRNGWNLIASLSEKIEIKGAMIAELIPQGAFLKGGSRTRIEIQNPRK